VFTPNQRWLITASVDERSPAQIWDLQALRKELADRGLDWAPDILQPTAEDHFQESLEVVLDGGVYLGKYASGINGNGSR
jgi:hypothetical protein